MPAPNSTRPAATKPLLLAGRLGVGILVKRPKPPTLGPLQTGSGTLPAQPVAQLGAMVCHAPLSLRQEALEQGISFQVLLNVCSAGWAQNVPCTRPLQCTGRPAVPVAVPLATHWRVGVQHSTERPHHMGKLIDACCAIYLSQTWTAAGYAALSSTIFPAGTRLLKQLTCWRCVEAA